MNRLPLMKKLITLLVIIGFCLNVSGVDGAFGNSRGNTFIGGIFSPSGNLYVSKTSTGVYYQNIEDFLRSDNAIGGTWGWNAENTAGGSQLLNGANGVPAGFLGYVALKLDGTAAARSHMFVGNSRSSTLGAIKLGSYAFYYETRIALSTIALTNTSWYHGLTDTRTELLAANAVHFKYNKAVSNNWLAETCSASSRTTNITSIVVTENAWTVLSIYVDTAAANAYFYVDGVAAATNTANIPTLTMLIEQSGYSTTGDAVAGTNFVDYVWYARAP
mgnify:CR=1 FL=1